MLNDLQNILTKIRFNWYGLNLDEGSLYNDILTLFIYRNENSLNTYKLNSVEITL